MRRAPLRAAALTLLLAAALHASAAQAGRPRPNPSGIDSDDFAASCTQLRPFWTAVDPLGDASLELVQDAAGQSRLELGVPGGSSHDIWTSGNRAPRVMQAASDIDFEIEAKFESVPSLARQGQGILVEEAPGNHIRFEIFHDGSTLRLYVATFVANQPTVRINQAIGGGAALYLRVARTGDTWQPSYGFDGTVWTPAASFAHALAVSGVGVHVTNGGVPASSSPAFTSRVDYFANRQSPGRVEFEDFFTDTPRILTTSATGSGTVQRDPDLPSYACGTEVLLTALPSPEHGFTGWSGGVTSSENPLLLTITKNLEVTASFAPDPTPPVLSGIAAAVSETSALVTWTTDEPATSQVAYGATPAYELGSESQSALVTSHAIPLAGLAPGTTYHFRVTSVDGAGFPAQSGDLVFTTLGAGPSAPQIDVWYGAEQSFGALGVPQPWANVAGNVQDPDGVASLSYTLNGGAPRTLRVGADQRRLPAEGDFNADIPVADLLPGPNSVVIRAEDQFGNVSTASVALDFDGGGVWPLPYTADWSATANLLDAAQPVDGLWEIQGASVRSLRLGYDRLLAIGDLAWTDYEVTVPITIHSFDPIVWQPDVIGPAAAVGVLLRWQGHSDQRGTQPFDWPFPFGAICWYRIYPTTSQLEINRNLDATPIPKQGISLAFGVAYVFKARVETVPGVGGLYRFKVWPQGQPEPTGWNLQAQEDLADPQNGSILLLVHHVDASFGTVTVTPLP